MSVAVARYATTIQFQLNSTSEIIHRLATTTLTTRFFNASYRA